MIEAGYNRDWKQCRAKIKNLKGEYRATKIITTRVTMNGKHASFFMNLMLYLNVDQHPLPKFCSSHQKIMMATEVDSEDSDGGKC